MGSLQLGEFRRSRPNVDDKSVVFIPAIPTNDDDDDDGGGGGGEDEKDEDARVETAATTEFLHAAKSGLLTELPWLNAPVPYENAYAREHT